MSVLAGYSLISSVAERFGRTALNLVLSGCTCDADGIDFSTSATNNATIAYADASAFRVANNAPFSFHIRFRTGADVLDETLIRSSDHSTNNAGWYLMTNGSGQLEFNYSDNTGTTRRTFTGPTLTANTDYDISVNVTDMLGNNAGVTFWVNGTQTSPTGGSTSGAAAYAAGAQVSFGNWGRYGTARNSTHRLRKFALLDVVSTTQMHTDWSANPDNAMDAWNSNMAIDSAPSSIVRGTAFNIVVSGTATAPTTGNTTVRLNGSSGPTCTVNSVSGSGPWTINCTAASNIAIKHSTTGYPVHVAVASESRQTANIQFSPPAGYSFRDLTSASTGANSIISDYVPWTPVAGDQIVFATATTPDNLAVAVSAAGIASYTGTLTQNNSFPYYGIRADGSIGGADSLTFSYSALSITSVNGGAPIPNGEGDIPIVVSNTAGVTSVSLNGVAQQFAIVNSTLIYLDNSAWPNCVYGQTISLAVSTGGTSASANTSMRPSGTNNYATADGTYNAAAVGTILGNPQVVAGDQLEFEYPSSNGANFTIGGNWRPVDIGPNPGHIRCRILDATDKTFGTWFNWSITADTGGATAPVITGVTGARMGQTVTVNCTSAVNLSTATGLGIIVGGVSLTGVQATGPQTLTGQMPVQGIQLGANRPVQVTANGVTSTAYNASVQSALGQVVTLTVPYAQLSPDSPLRDPAFAAAYGHLVAGDQIEWATPSTPGGYAVAVSSTGVVTLSGAGSDPAAQTVQFALIDASDSYSRSNVGTWSLYAAGVATRLQIPAGSVDGANLPMAGRTVTANVHEMDVVNNRIGPFLYTAQLTFATTGPTNLDSISNGPLGTVRALGIASANGHSFHPITVQAAS